MDTQIQPPYPTAYVPRPAKPLYQHRLAVSISTAQKLLLDEAAARAGIPSSQYVREAVAMRLDEEAQPQQ